MNTREQFNLTMDKILESDFAQKHIDAIFTGRIDFSQPVSCFYLFYEENPANPASAEDRRLFANNIDDIIGQGQFDDYFPPCSISLIGSAEYEYTKLNGGVFPVWSKQTG